MTFLLVFFTSLVTTLFLTPFFISFLKKTKIVDFPGGRKIHKSVIPRMGGLVIFLVVLTMINAFVEDFDSVKLIIISVTILVFIGIIDDVINLNRFIKFVIQNISAIFLVYYLQPLYNSVTIFGITLQNPYDYLFILIFIIGTVNSINFLDGLDGLASGFSLLIFIVLLALAIRKNDTFLILLTVSLLGSILGFLKFNAFPASVFLGDTGALVLGFFLIFISLLTSINYHDSNLDLTFPLILLGVPLLDTAKVFVLRIWLKKDPFSPDTKHQHHILQKSIVNYELTVFVIQLFSLAFILLALFYLKDYRTETTILFFLLGGILIGIQPFLLRFRVADIFDKFLISFRKNNLENVFIFIKSLIVASAILMAIIVIVSFSIRTSLSSQELIFLIVAISVLFLVSYFQSKKIDTISDLGIFINFTIFFVVTKLSLPIIDLSTPKINLLEIIHNTSFYVLALLISITMILRWKAFAGKRMLFTGIDLTIIVFMLLTFIVNKVLEFDYNYYLSISFLEAFIFYIWYKIIIDFKKKYSGILTLVSFLLPISLLVTLLIFKL
jgi:UDP-GlcNAc:undecaprenyl-phosphate GlcNAc-1-phosphate transferase